jgi:hypothetical protein
MLVKGTSTPWVYYVASDKRLYWIATRTHLASWYTHRFDVQEDPKLCRTVREFPDATMQQMVYGTNVKVRPGTFLITRSGDTMVYATSRHGTLRRVGTRTLKPGCTQPDMQTGPLPCWTLRGSNDDLAFTFFPDADERMRLIPVNSFVGQTIGESLLDASGHPDPNATPYDPDAEYDWGSPNTMEAELGL